MKNRLVALSLFVLFILTVPSINAITVKKTTDESEKPEDTGTIYGWTGYCHWPGYTPVSFVRVWIGTRFTISDLYGDFSISGLPLDHQYTVYYTRWDYVTKSEEVFLSITEPNEEVSLMFNENDKRTINEKSKSSEVSNCLGCVYGQVRYISSIIGGSYRINGLALDQEYTITYSNSRFKTKTTKISNENYIENKLTERIVYDELPAGTGLIYGRTGGVIEHASWPVGFTTLEFGNRKKISGYFCFYVIGFLRIGETYSITASKEDYSDLTLEVTLTAERPIQRLNFFMYPD